MVDDVRREVREQEGEEPIVAGNVWTLPGELLLLRRNPVVYSIGLAVGDRCSQFDLWHPNPLSEPDDFRGKTFVLVGNPTDALFKAFPGGVSPLREVIYAEKGQPIACWHILICRGYTGLKVPVVYPK